MKAVHPAALGLEAQTEAVHPAALGLEAQTEAVHLAALGLEAQMEVETGQIVCQQSLRSNNSHLGMEMSINRMVGCMDRYNTEVLVYDT
ncbi:hypothetical protein [Neobacillus sp. Marseille-QA0830]